MLPTKKRTQIMAFGLIIIVIGAASFGLIYATSYNDLVNGRNAVTANYQNVLAAYDKFYTNTELSIKVANYSVNAQIQLNEIATELRTGNSISGSGVDVTSQVPTLNKIDSLTTTFMATYTAEAYPNLNTAQLTELNSVMNTSLSQVNSARVIYSESVASYNSGLESIPNNWLNGTFHWGFGPLQGYNPTTIYTPDQLVNSTGVGLTLP